MANNPKQVKTPPSDIDRFNKGQYKGIKLSVIATRPNSMDILSKPSRIKNSLFYPDGTITKENDNAGKG
jgi:hypothetical protein